MTYKSPTLDIPGHRTAIHWLMPERKVQDAETASACGLQLVRITPASYYFKTLSDGSVKPLARRATASLRLKERVTCKKCRESMVKLGILELTS